jgi:hypothetical protein
MNYSIEHPTIAVAQARSFDENERFVKRHQPLAVQLARRGARLIALNGAKDRLEGDAFSRFYSFEGDELAQHDSTTRVDAAFDLSGGIARYTHAVPALNPEKLRDTASSKFSQYEALKTLGEQVPETLLAAPLSASVEDAMDRMQADRFILKDNNSANLKRGMLLGTKDEIRSHLNEYLEKMNPGKDSVVIQEYMHEVFSDFADGITPVDEAEREIVAASRGLARELRVHTIDGTPLLVTGRSGLDAQKRSPLDEWVHIHQETVPQAITTLAAKASRLMMAHANARDAYLAIDITPDGSRIVEVNGRNIGTMSYDAARPASKVAHEKTTHALADKLMAMAHRKKEEG